jgi:hypothetical protein
MAPAAASADCSHRRQLGGQEVGRGGSRRREGSDLGSRVGRDSPKRAVHGRARRPVGNNGDETEGRSPEVKIGS